MNARKLAIALVMGIAAASPAYAQQDVLAGLPAPAQKPVGSGWNTKYALLFQLQNVFSDGNGILNDYAGGVGAQLNLAPDRAIRVSVGLSRASNPPYETETRYAGGPVEKEDVIPAITSSFATTIRGSYLVRLSESPIAPYLGAGASLRFASTARDGTDDDTAGTKIVYDDSTHTFAFGLVGQLGLEWRVHQSVSLFAEYGLEVNAFERRSGVGSTTYNGSETRSEYSQTKFMNFSTGLEQGGELGLVAFF